MQGSFPCLTSFLLSSPLFPSPTMSSLLFLFSLLPSLPFPPSYRPFFFFSFYLHPVLVQVFQEADVKMGLKEHQFFWELYLLGRGCFPGSSDGKASAYKCGRPGFNPLVGKIPWRRKWQSTPVFLPGKSHGLRILVGYSLWGRKESDTTERLHFHLPVGENMGRELKKRLEEAMQVWPRVQRGRLERSKLNFPAT